MALVQQEEAVHEAVSRKLFIEGVKGLTPELAASRGWILQKIEYPVVDLCFTAPSRAPIRARFLWDGWDSQPPSIEWLTPSGEYLTTLPPTPRGQLNSSQHPATARPFVCMIGAREYHNHPSHIGDSWENYRSRPGYDLGGIITQVWRAWGEGSQ